MTESSDLDLLVIKSRGPHEPQEEHECWRCQETGDDLDVVLVDPATAERRRRSAAYIPGAALESLWKEAGANGERIGATPDPEELAKLTRYAGEWQYPVDGIDPETTWSLMEPAGRDVLHHARNRVPELMKETGERLRESTRGYRSVSSTRSATRSAMASDAVRPGESIPAAWTSRGWRRSRRIRKSENVCSAGAARARMPLPPGRS